MKSKNSGIGDVLIYLIFIIVCIGILYPFWCIVSVSFMSAKEISSRGFSLWPGQLDFTAYKSIFVNPAHMLKAYGTTILVAVLGTLIGGIVTTLYAYTLSRKSYPFRRVLSFYSTFTMFFSGGMAAKYIITVSVLNLKNSLWVLILPIAFSAMNVIIVKAYFEQLPYSLVESAKIDGASEYTVFARIMFPLAKPAIATICLTMFVTYWNSYYEAMMYMDSGNYVTIQLLLQRMFDRIELAKSMASSGLAMADSSTVPTEAYRMAMCVMTVIPMVLVFPRFQKYFVKGMAIGAVKE